MRLALVLAMMLLALPAQASPWPREAGETFISLSTNGGGLGLWAEYGLGRGNWLVLDAMRGQDGHMRAQLGWNRALGRTNRRHRFAIGVAGGAEVSATGETMPYIFSSASWGMGIQRPFDGWVSVYISDRAGFSPQTGEIISVAKGNATLGVNLGERWKIITEVQARYADPAFEVHLAPSVVWEVRRGIHLELGLRQGIMGTQTQEVTLGSWFRF